MILLNCFCLIGIVWAIRVRECWDEEDILKCILTIIVILLSVCTFTCFNNIVPYKEIGLVLSEPETKITQLEHNGQKYEGLVALYPVKEFGPPVRPAEYKKQYKNFYGAVID